jgi:imidazole glycerol-phosphate synthase subunit HisF
MRRSPTSSEELLWSRIRGRRLGVVFRRQVPLLGCFIADFLAPAQRLVIEADGVRIEASLVVSDIERALRLIEAALSL